MYARVSAAQIPAERVEEGITLFRERLAPAMASQPGFAGAHVLMDRQQGKVLVVVLWESREAMERSEGASAPQREQAARDLGVDPPAVERYEVAIAEGAPSGRYARVTTVQGLTGGHEAGLRYVRERVLPGMQARPGFGGMLHLVDEQAGKVLGVVFFNSEEALRDSDDQARELRAGADREGLSGTRSAQNYEVVVQHQSVGQGA